jgi:hypothetical protein
MEIALRIFHNFILYVFLSVDINSILLSAVILVGYSLLKSAIIFLFSVHCRMPFMVVQQKKCQEVNLSSFLPGSVVWYNYCGVQRTPSSSDSSLFLPRNLHRSSEVNFFNVVVYNFVAVVFGVVATFEFWLFLVNVN